MARYGMLIDTTRCIGCYACRIACQSINSLAPNEGYIRFEHLESGAYPNVADEVVPIQCMHCEDAPCAKVCPTRATHITDSGVVLTDEDKCIGCKYCMAACPYGVRIQKENGSVEKCRFCWYNGNPGNPPACVKTCITKARVFGDLDDPESEISKEIAKRGARPLAGHLTDAKIYYVR